MAEFERGRHTDKTGRQEFPKSKDGFRDPSGKKEKRARRKDKKRTKCPYCDGFEGMFTAEQRCVHMKIYHEAKITEILDRVDPRNIKNLRDRGVDPFCWAAGMAFIK